MTSSTSEAAPTDLLFFGAGRMGGALLRAVLKSGLVPADRVAVVDPDPSAAERAAELGCRVVPSPTEALPADCVILAVKPGLVPTVAASLRGLTADSVVCSVAAGVTLRTLRAAIGSGIPLVRVMPNINALSASAVHAVTFGPDVSAPLREKMTRLLAASGTVVEVPEEAMDAVTGLAGSGPAFVARFVRGMVDGGVRCGLTPESAYRMALGTLQGTALTLETMGWSPAEMEQTVASPGGTTVEGLKVLDSGRLSETVAEAVVAACRKSAALAAALGGK